MKEWCTFIHHEIRDCGSFAPTLRFVWYVFVSVRHADVLYKQILANLNVILKSDEIRKFVGEFQKQSLRILGIILMCDRCQTNCDKFEIPGKA